MKPEEKEAIELLQKLGFSRYEAILYVTLLKHGPLSARSLSEISEVPYSKVYSILSTLARKGFITIIESRPKKFAPVDPKHVLPVYVKTIIDELLETRDKLMPLLEKIRLSSEEIEEKRVFLIRDPKLIAAKVAEAIEGAKVYVKLSGPSWLIDRLKEELKKAVKRGVKVRVISPRDPNVPGIEWKQMNVVGGGIIVDGTDVIILMKEADSFIALYSDHPSLAVLAETYYEILRNQTRGIL